jgi:hypothetical protein
MSRQMAWQWNRKGLEKAIDSLDRFIVLSGIGNQLVRLPEAIKRSHLEEGDARELRIAREVTRAIVRRGCQTKDIRRVVAWRTPGAAEKVEIEWVGSGVEPIVV